jgi:hypothetical protein
MINQTSENIVFNLIKEAVESEGCHIEEVDFERLTIRVDGPIEVVSDCARAVAEVLD